MSVTRCGNPECPSQPEIDEPSNVAFEQRKFCPVCGSRIRAHFITVHDSVQTSDTAAAGIARKSQAVTGEASIALTATVTASGIVGQQSPSKLRLTGLGLEVTHSVTVLMADLEDRPDSPCVIEVRNADNVVLVTGVGDTAADAVASVFEHMLPPSSSEYLAPDDDLPGHDSDS